MNNCNLEDNVLVVAMNNSNKQTSENNTANNDIIEVLPNTNDEEESIYEINDSDTESINIEFDIPNDEDVVLLHADRPPTQSHLRIVDRDHLSRLETIFNEEKTEVTADTHYIDGLKLMNLLMKKDISLTSYNEFMTWKFSSKSKMNYMSKQNLEKTALKRVYGPTLTERMEPKTSSLKLPSGLKVNVTTFPFDGIMYDLLSDRELMQHHNLIFRDGDASNPFYVDADSTMFNDFDSSTYYHRTIAKNDATNKEILTCPLVLYMDEATLDSYSKLSFHPVCCTFMIFNRKTRNKERAWRTLGYMPNLANLTGNKSLSPVRKLADFHYILRYIIDGIAQVQQMGGVDWTFRFDKFRGQEYKRLIKFPLGVWIGDGKGNDTICGKFQNRTNTTHVCRDCNVLLNDSDKHNAECKFHKMKDIRKMSKDELHSICFHKVHPTFAFDDIDFGANPYGINGCTPVDICHQVNKGFEELLPSIFKNRLTKKMVKEFDVHCAFICSNMRRQSERDVPSIRAFTKGTSDTSKLTANENVGRVFACFLTITSRDFEKLVVGKKGRKVDKETKATEISQSEYNKWIMIFEEVLIIHAWINLEEHPKVFFNGGSKSVVADRIRVFMKKIMETAKRREGKGMKTMKWHQILHWWWIFRMFSSLLNVDSSREESHHRKKNKLHQRHKGDLIHLMTRQLQKNLCIMFF